MTRLNSGIFLGCVVLSISTDAALLLNPDLVPYSFIVKGSIMAILSIFPIALSLRTSTYKSPDILLLLMLNMMFFFYSPFSEYPPESANRAFKQLYLSIIYLSFIYFLRCGSLKRTDLVLLASISCTIILPVGWYVTFNPADEHLSQAAGPYAILWLLLFGFLVVEPRDKLLMVLMVIGTLVLLLIMKRGAILCLGTALATWLFLRNRYYPRLNTLVSNLLALSVLFTLIGVFWVTRGEQFAERLQDTSGSGRDILYGFIFRGFIEADITQLLFGHGSMAVQILSGITLGVREGAKYGLQAHSDWLTLAYDFGLFGVVLFAIFQALVFRKIRQLRYLHTSLYIKLLPVYLALFLNSIFSEFLFNTSAVFLYLFLAIASSPQRFRTLVHGA